MWCGWYGQVVGRSRPTFTRLVRIPTGVRASTRRRSAARPPGADHLHRLRDPSLTRLLALRLRAPPGVLLAVRVRERVERPPRLRVGVERRRERRRLLDLARCLVELERERDGIADLHPRRLARRLAQTEQELTAHPHDRCAQPVPVDRRSRWEPLRPLADDPHLLVGEHECAPRSPPLQLGRDLERSHRSILTLPDSERNRARTRSIRGARGSAPTMPPTRPHGLAVQDACLSRRKSRVRIPLGVLVG